MTKLIKLSTQLNEIIYNQFNMCKKSKLYTVDVRQAYIHIYNLTFGPSHCQATPVLLNFRVSLCLIIWTFISKR